MLTIFITSLLSSHMTSFDEFDIPDSTGSATLLKSTRFRNSESSVQIQIKYKSYFDFAIQVSRFGGFLGCSVF